MIIFQNFRNILVKISITFKNKKILRRNSIHFKIFNTTFRNNWIVFKKFINICVKNLIIFINNIILFRKSIIVKNCNKIIRKEFNYFKKFILFVNFCKIQLFSGMNIKKCNYRQKNLNLNIFKKINPTELLIKMIKN